MKMYGVISWGYKPSHTYLVFVGKTEDECINYLRQAAINETIITSKFSLEEITEWYKDDERVTEWAYEHSYIIDCYTM
mgnify:CR=1 FL=1